MKDVQELLWMDALPFGGLHEGGYNAVSFYPIV